jgi:predicted Ser/Thr protein kinase
MTDKASMKRRKSIILFRQRAIVCIRLSRVLLRLLFRNQFHLSHCLPIEKKGIGQSSTFLLGKQVVIKVKNELASNNNRKKYNGAFDGLFFYEDTVERLRKEYDLYAELSDCGITARPLLFTEYAIALEYLSGAVTLGECETISDEIVTHIFQLIDKLHEMGIFHGDLNCNNLLVKNGSIYVIDFESSRHVEKHKEEDLYCLDIIIFIRRLYQLYPKQFRTTLPSVHSQVERLRVLHPLLVDQGKKYLPLEVYNELF